MAGGSYFIEKGGEMMDKHSAEAVLECLPVRLRRFVVRQEYWQQQTLSELRLRAACPLNIRAGQADVLYDGSSGEAFICSADEIEQFMRAALHNSYYALEGMLREGYFTLAGGSRVGISGRAVLQEGRISGFAAIRSVNIRLARQHELLELAVLPLLTDADGYLYSTLLIGPPLSGKTTLLRAILRLASSGQGGLRPMQTGVVDEKSELAGLSGVQPSFDVGSRTDIIDGCPKGEGMMRLIRNMAPQLLVTDELGHAGDAAALSEAVRCGVRVLTSAHGDSLAELGKRPLLRELVAQGGFQRAVVLSRQPIGSIKAVYDMVQGVRLK